MRLKLTKFNLRLASVIMVAISVAAVALSVLLPVNSTVLSSTTAIQLPSTAPASTQSVEKIDLFSDLLDVNLRKPLIDPPHNASPSVPVNADATLGLRLTGTIIEPTHSYAVFTDAAGKSEIKSLGDKAGGADISDITPDSVTLRLAGRSMVLHAVKPPAIGSAGS